MREPPRMPPAADCSATGLSLNGCSFMRDTQSIAFFRPPGIDQLYSGDTMITPSALRMASAQVFTSAGKPLEFLDVEVVDRKGLERRRRAKLHSDRRQRRQGARERRVVGAFAQRAADHEHIELPVSHDSPPEAARQRRCDAN